MKKGTPTYRNRSSLLKIFFMVAGLALVVWGVLWGYSRWNEKPNTFDVEEEVELSMSSEDLVQAFVENEPEATTLFAEKTIDVQGQLKEISFLNNRYTIILYGGSKFNGLMCDMNPLEADKLAQLQEGDQIHLRGVCKGFLMDAILLNCVLLKPTE